MNIKVYNLNSPRTGNPVANQYEIITKDYYIFQSYNSIIAKRNKENGRITLDSYYWDYSKTTLKYLKEFLNINMNKKEIQEQIDSGIYQTANLNK
jgi:hypothetical protein